MGVRNAFLWHFVGCRTPHPRPLSPGRGEGGFGGGEEFLELLDCVGVVGCEVASFVGIGLVVVEFVFDRGCGV